MIEYTVVANTSI